MYVNVPWTNTTYSVQDGQLSQNNFTNADHDKLDGIDPGATLGYKVYRGYNDGVSGYVMQDGTSDGNTNMYFIGGSGITLSQATNYDGPGNDGLRITNSAPDTGVPAILSDGSTPSLNSGITAAEVRSLIGAGTATVNDTGTPAILSNGSTPSLNSGISAAEVRSIIGAGTSSSDTTYSGSGGITLSGTDFRLSNDQRKGSNTDVYVGAAETYCFFDHGSSGPDYIDWFVDGVEAMELQEGGELKVKGNVIAYTSSFSSDVKLKENIKRVEGALDKVSQLDGVTFNWKKDGKESAGVIAQNVEEVLPSAVKDVEELGSNDTYKAVDYNQLSALFIEAIKELKDENKLLRAEIESLKDINS